MLRRVWGLFSALFLGFAIALGGNFVWSILLAVNLGAGASTPWSPFLMIAVLALGWAYLGGAGLPRSSQALRRQLLPQSRLSAFRWATSLLTGLGALAAFLCALLIAYRLLPIPIQPLPPMVQSAPLLALAYFGAASIVAGMAEEAGFRGYMQSGLDMALGKTASTIIVALAFSALHAGNPEFLYLLPLYAGTSLALSVLVRASGSVWPGVVAHTCADFASYTLLLYFGATALTKPASLSAPDHALLVVAGVGAAGVFIAATGFVALASTRRAERVAVLASS